MDLIDWEIAGKIAAINKDDPFPNKPQTRYRLVDIFEDYKTIPSPIHPDNRDLFFECVWKISNQDDNNLENKIYQLENLINKMSHKDCFEFKIDKETIFFIYLRVIYRPTVVPYLSTCENLIVLEESIRKGFDEIESIVKEVFTEPVKCTKWYWLSELGVFL